MTDKELTDICNRWVGSDTGDPLNNWNDLVRVIEKVLVYHAKSVFIIMRPAICIQKSFDDVPRKVLELIADWENSKDNP